MMVGMTARADWRGPKVLKGRMVATGNRTSAVALHDLVRADLAGRVGRLSLQRMLLVDRHVERRAVDLAGRGVHDPAHVSAGLHHVEGAADVRRDTSSAASRSTGWR